MLAGPVDIDDEVDALGPAPDEVCFELIVELRCYGFGECPSENRYADVAGDTSGDLGGPHVIGVSGDPALVEHQ
jgi:hypothetical protein